jgi:hypothetical protein
MKFDIRIEKIQLCLSDDTMNAYGQHGDTSPHILVIATRRRQLASFKLLLDLQCGKMIPGAYW